MTEYRLVEKGELKGRTIYSRCSTCRRLKARDDGGAEAWIDENLPEGALASDGYCPECAAAKRAELDAVLDARGAELYTALGELEPEPEPCIVCGGPLDASRDAICSRCAPESEYVAQARAALNADEHLEILDRLAALEADAVDLLAGPNFALDKLQRWAVRRGYAIETETDKGMDFLIGAALIASDGKRFEGRGDSIAAALARAVLAAWEAGR